MNKTININLGGYFFHIDETAFQKLKRYLDAISRSLDPQGKNEIIADIEARISELLSEKITDARQVVNDNDIDEVIAIMGQPEDYAEAEEGYTETSSTYKRKKSTSKKFFRDGDDKFLGGVCSGIGHYVGIDTIWVRLAFIVLVASGVSPLAYIILWILLPEAKTTSEKLQMEGEAVNIDNIEKKIRNEFETLSVKLKDGANDISDKISGADYEQLRRQTKSGFQDFIDTVGKILAAVFKVFGKFLGAILLFVAGITLVSLFFTLFSVGSLEFLNIDGDMMRYPPFFYSSMVPKWLLSIFSFLLLAIPFVALFILGLRILSPNIKRLSTSTSLTLGGIWLVSLLGVGFSGIEYLTSRAHDGTKVTKHTIKYDQSAPLKLSVENNDDIYYQYDLRRRDNSLEVEINNEPMKYSNDVRIDVKKSETSYAYIEILKESEGKKRNIAIDNAEKIDYKFDVKDNKITFDAYFLSEFKNMWRNEEIRATLYVPGGTTVYFEESSTPFLDNVNDTDNMSDRNMANHHFIMTSEELDCTDCKSKNEDKETDDEWNSDDNNDEDLTFLFDSTINSTRAELIINKTTTKTELERLARWFKNKKDIDIDFSKSTFYKDGRIKDYALKVDCNDGFSGKTEQKGIPIKKENHGFYRNYNKKGELAFKIW